MCDGLGVRGVWPCGSGDERVCAMGLHVVRFVRLASGCAFMCMSVSLHHTVALPRPHAVALTATWVPIAAHIPLC